MRAIRPSRSWRRRSRKPDSAAAVDRLAGRRSSGVCAPGLPAEEGEGGGVEGEQPAGRDPDEQQARRCRTEIVASQTCALASELAARRPSVPPISASIVYWPALPQLASSDEPASRAMYAAGESGPPQRARRSRRESTCGAGSGRGRARGPDGRGGICRARAPGRRPAACRRPVQPDEEAELAGRGRAQGEPCDRHGAHPVAEGRDAEPGEQPPAPRSPRSTRYACGITRDPLSRLSSPFCDGTESSEAARAALGSRGSVGRRRLRARRRRG